MNKDKLKLWVDALRSGEYQQGKNSLAKYDDDGTLKFCCLGVACEVAIKDGLNLPVFEATAFPDNRPVRREYGQGRDIGFMPEEVCEWLGHDDTNVIVDLLEYIPEITNPQEYVAYLNDGDSWTFEQIADALERTYLKEKQ